MFLVDANVLSESTRREPNTKVLTWLDRHKRTFVVDPIVLGEIRLGILLLGPGKRRDALEEWFETVVKTVDCIPWDRSVSMRWAKLVADMKQRGTRLPVADSMIAATALTHNFVVATRNVDHFQRAGVTVVNPFK